MLDSQNPFYFTVDGLQGSQKLTQKKKKKNDVNSSQALTVTQY